MITPEQRAFFLAALEAQLAAEKARADEYQRAGVTVVEGADDLRRQWAEIQSRLESDLAAARAQVEWLAALLTEAREAVLRWSADPACEPGDKWRPLSVRGLAAKIDAAIDAAKGVE